MSKFGRGKTAAVEEATPVVAATVAAPAPAQPYDRLAEKNHSPDAVIEKTVNPLAATKEKIYTKLMEQIDLQTASRLPELELRRQIINVIGEIVIEQKLAINQTEQQFLARDANR